MNSGPVNFIVLKLFYNRPKSGCPLLCDSATLLWYHKAVVREKLCPARASKVACATDLLPKKRELRVRGREGRIIHSGRTSLSLES